MYSHDQLEEVLLEARHGLIAIFGDKLEKLWLYGSYARGEATPESDIDVMVLVNMGREELSTYRRPVSNFISDIDLKYDVLLGFAKQRPKRLICLLLKKLLHYMTWNPRRRGADH